MKLLSLIIVFCFFAINVNAQDCENSKFLKEGTKWEMSNYDKKDKFTGLNKYETLSEEATANGMNWVIQVESSDEKGEETISSSTVNIGCENGVYQMDFTAFLPAETLENFQNMEVEMENNNIDFPNSLNTSTTLEDASTVIKTTSSGVTIMTLNINITDREIEGVETIETEAGSFECLKITQTTNMKMGFINQTYSSTTWFLPTFGAVRTESFNKKGKLIGYSELSSLTLP